MTGVAATATHLNADGDHNQGLRNLQKLDAVAAGEATRRTSLASETANGL
jgi:hypothetical protein